jgi:hypothetical protein
VPAFPNLTVVGIDIINASTVLQDGDFNEVVLALQQQVSEHFASQWGIDAHLHFVPSGGSADAAHWQIVVLDNSDQAGTAGYHDLTSAGLPMGKVFAETDRQYNQCWTVTLSHELLEMLEDPDINLVAFGPDENLWAYEMCDVVEDDSYGYEIDGVAVSDFVYPAFFESFREGVSFDHTGQLHAPFWIAPKGYSGIYVIGQGWTQQAGQDATQSYKARAPVGSRRERRIVGRDRWLHSSR